MKLATLLNGMVDCTAELEINGLSIDSRTTEAGQLFIALHGANQHGLDHVAQAITKGAVAVLYDPTGLETTNVQLPVFSLPLSGLDKHLGAIAAKFYGYPTRNLLVIGVTGTNGKTTCSQLIAQALTNCGVIGTLGWGEPEALSALVNTTPDALCLQKILRQLVLQEKTHVAMEVSSHGLQQGRVNSIDFTGAVFTNLSRDHLDYHGSMDEYLKAKTLLFINPSLQFAVLNADDEHAETIRGKLENTVKCWTFSTLGRSISQSESIIAENYTYSPQGIACDIVWGINKISVFSPLVGRFNLENLLAVFCVLLALGIPLPAAAERLRHLKSIAGRMEKLGGGNLPQIFIDYAHTPDALEKALQAAKGSKRLWLVFGCGGNRDTGKRQQMGWIADSLADEIILTNDNPRNEPPTQIISDIMSGILRQNARVIEDRKIAIETAIQLAEKDDCILIAGKGHENYQEINGQRWPFSDRDVVTKAIERRFN